MATRYDRLKSIRLVAGNAGTRNNKMREVLEAQHYTNLFESMEALPPPNNEFLARPYQAKIIQLTYFIARLQHQNGLLTDAEFADIKPVVEPTAAQVANFVAHWQQAGVGMGKRRSRKLAGGVTLRQLKEKELKKVEGFIYDVTEELFNLQANRNRILGTIAEIMENAPPSMANYNAYRDNFGVPDLEESANQLRSQLEAKADIIRQLNGHKARLERQLQPLETVEEVDEEGGSRPKLRKCRKCHGYK